MMLEIGHNDRPYLPRGVRIVEDRVRGGRILLAPEKAVALDAIGEAILDRVNGEATFGAIVKDLADTYEAPQGQIAADVQRFMMGLRSRIFLRVKT